MEQPLGHSAEFTLDRPSMRGETWAILGGGPWADTENLDVCLVSSPQNMHQNNFRAHKM